MIEKGRISVRTLVIIALLSAMACVLMLLVNISFMPGNEFLIFDLKDVPIIIGGFLFGPYAVIAMSIVVSFIEMVTVSKDGWVGFAMNVLSTCAFACPAALIYMKKRNLKGAVIGLVAGWLFVTGVMVLWNYVVTPVYRGFPRAAIVPMLATVFMPFNLIKYGFSAAISMLVYKPVSLALKKAKIIVQSEKKTTIKENLVIGIILAICLAAIPFVFLILVQQGVISPNN